MATGREEEAAFAVEPNCLSEIAVSDRYRLTNELTRQLDLISRKFGVAILGGQVEPIDMAWNGPDAEKWEQYALTEDNNLIRGFWNQHRGQSRIDA